MPEDASAPIENALQTFETNTNQLIASNLSSQNHSNSKQRQPHQSNLTSDQLAIIQELQDNDDLHIGATDKNLGPFIMERDAYLQQCSNEHLLVPRNYQQLSKEEALRHIYEVKQEIEHLHGLSGAVRGKRTPEQTYFERSLADAKRTPQFYAMPKVHKAKLKFRPVISACGSPLEVESKFLDFHLQRVIHLCPAHLKDSAGLIDQLQQLGPLPPNARLITADAVSMSTLSLIPL